MRPEPPSKHSAMPVFLSIVAAPTIFGAAILVGLEDVMFVAFFPIFLIQNNLSQELALQYVTIAIVGVTRSMSLILQHLTVAALHFVKRQHHNYVPWCCEDPKTDDAEQTLGVRT